MACLDAYEVSGFRGKICKHSDHLHKCGSFEFNELDLELMGFPDDMIIVLTTKLYLPPIGQRPSSLDVRHALAAAQEAGGKYLGPSARHGTSTHMAMFDPTNCLCLVHPGSELVEVPLAEPNLSHCRNNVLRSEASEGLKWLHIGPPQNYSHLIHYKFWVWRCSSECQKLQLVYSTKFSLHKLDKHNWNKVHPTWYRAVSPDSYGMTEDVESRHMLWCPDAQCRNYYSNPGIDRFWGWEKG